MNYAKHLPAASQRQKLFASIYIVCIFKFISFAFQFVRQIIKVALQPAGETHIQIRRQQREGERKREREKKMEKKRGEKIAKLFGTKLIKSEIRLHMKYN